MRTRAIAKTALLSIALIACSGSSDNGPPRSPLGVAGKPIVDTATGPVIGDELLLRFVDSATDSVIADLLEAVDGKITYRSRATGYSVAQFGSVDSTHAAFSSLRRDGRVADVAFNHIMRGSGLDTSPVEELAVLQWNLYALDLNPFSNWANATGVTIAVLDTGVAYESYSDSLGNYALASDLEDVDFAAGYDFVNDDDHPNDDQGHGTHVAGVIAAQHGIASLAYEATIIPIKVLDQSSAGTELGLAEGLMFAAESEADVVNMSLTFPPTYFPSRLIQEAIDAVAMQGSVMLGATGNHGEAVVAYPAGFRNVIAVGASELSLDDSDSDSDTDSDSHSRSHSHSDSRFHSDSDSDGPWGDFINNLARAPYSNHSYSVDVVAPAGNILADINNDGMPEAVLAQTFPTGDPMDLGYYFYAGTSQATAQASGLAAVMLAKNSDLTPFQIRALLGETAKQPGGAALSHEVGRGFVRGRQVINKSDRPQATRDRSRFFADVVVSLHDVNVGTVARAHVEVIDASGLPVENATVYGMFTGAAFESVVGVTNHDGLVEFDSGAMSGVLLAAFQVEAVTTGHGGSLEFDRPQGFIRIDSTSLEELSIFGSGLDTSPVTPLSIKLDASLFSSSYRDTLLLPNFSWGLSTGPMAVAVDEGWFIANVPNAAAKRVVSFGRGFGGSSFLFNENSFPAPIAMLENSGARVGLIVLTFTSGVGTDPFGRLYGLDTSPAPRSILVDTYYSNISTPYAIDLNVVLDGWFASAAGLDTSPVWSTLLNMNLVMFDHLSAVATSYLDFAQTSVAGPASFYGSTLDAASMPVAPVSPDADGEGFGISSLP